MDCLWWYNRLHVDSGGIMIGRSKMIKEKPKHTASMVVNGIRRTLEVETSYDKRGPHISERNFETIKARLLSAEKFGKK